MPFGIGFLVIVNSLHVMCVLGKRLLLVHNVSDLSLIHSFNGSHIDIWVKKIIAYSFIV